MTTGVRRVRVGVAVALVVAGVVWLIGCIPVPAFYQHAGEGPRPEKLIGGKASSDKPLAVGRSTIWDAERVFGVGGYRVAGAAVYVRPYRVVSWYYLVCGFIPEEKTEQRWLVIRFGPDGRIRDYDVYSQLPAAYAHRGPEPPLVEPLPPGEEQRIRERLTARRRAETRPATTGPADGR